MPPLELAVAVSTDGGGGVTHVGAAGKLDLLIKSGPRAISSKAWTCCGGCGFGAVAVAAVPVPVPAPDPDICETMVRLWLLLNPVSFHFSETKNDRDLVLVVPRIPRIPR